MRTTTTAFLVLYAADSCGSPLANFVTGTVPSVVFARRRILCDETTCSVVCPSKWSVPPGSRLYVSSQGPHPAAARSGLKTRKTGSSCPVFRSPASRLPLGLRRRLFHYQAEWFQGGHGPSRPHNPRKHRNGCPRPGARRLKRGARRIVAIAFKPLRFRSQATPPARLAVLMKLSRWQGHFVHRRLPYALLRQNGTVPAPP